MHNKITTFVSYVSWLVKKHKELLNQQFKIIKFSKNKNNEDILHIQLTNKAVIFKCTPQEIINYENLIEGFSKKDVRTITYLATKNELEHCSYIFSYRFCEQTKKYFFKIKNKNFDFIDEYSASDISNNMEILNSLNQKDAHKVGYFYSIEQKNIENEFLLTKKRTG